MRALGYEPQGLRGFSQGPARSVVEEIRDVRTLAVLFAGLQLSFCLVGLFQRWLAAKQQSPLPPLFSEATYRPIAIGIVGGVGLLVLGVIYRVAMQSMFGDQSPGPWDTAHQLPAETKFAFLLFGAVGAPIAEEIFFRGYVFGLFRRAGSIGSGIAFSGFLFAAAHITDPYNMPIIWLFGCILAWLYHRTGSLLTSMTAHSVNNSVAILVMTLG